MGNVWISGGTGGADTSVVTATAEDVIKGKVIVGPDGKPIIGTMELTGNAEAKYVYSGKTFYNTNPKRKEVGTMTVSSVVSFSVAAYSTDKVTATWQWPAAGPYSGVIICAKEGGYPANINDSRVYAGVGSGSALGSKSSVIIGGLKAGIKYYFRIWVYCTVSAGDIYSGYRDATCQTTSKGQQNFTSSGIFTVPDNVREVQVFLVGGGGRGGSRSLPSGSTYHGGGGGGGGYTNTFKIAVTPKQQISVVVGAGGHSVWPKGNVSSFDTKTVEGGTSNSNGDSGEFGLNGGPGGSGGGGGVIAGGTGGRGGSDGNNGTNSSKDTSGKGGPGQGRTTRAFGEPSGTLYAGGGGGGSGSGTAGAGGSGGGGAGAVGSNSRGRNGTANTGGGGGGMSAASSSNYGEGGSGIVLVRWGY